MDSLSDRPLASIAPARREYRRNWTILSRCLSTFGAEAMGERMSSYELNRAIHRVYTDRGNTMAFRGGDYRVLDAFDLTAEEREALTGRDFPRLWALHVHPVLLFHLSVVLNPREWYMKEVVPKIRGVPNRWYDYYAPEQAGTKPG